MVAGSISPHPSPRSKIMTLPINHFFHYYLFYYYDIFIVNIATGSVCGILHRVVQGRQFRGQFLVQTLRHARLLVLKDGVISIGGHLHDIHRFCSLRY